MSEESKPMSLVPLHPRPMSVMSYCPSLAVSNDPDEQRYFHRFVDKTSSEICGTFDPIFWTEKIPQLCQQVAAIRYATIAVAALARSLEMTSSPTRLSLSGFPQIDQRQLDEHHRFALKMYSRAISSLRIILSDGRRHLRTSLTACVLFMTFEAMVGNYEGALTHLRGGSRLLADWRIARRGGSNRLSHDSLSEIQDSLVDDLGRMFARLDVQGLFIPWPHRVPNLLQDDMEIPDEFDSLQEAREIWDFLVAAIGQFYQKSVVKAHEDPESLNSPAWIKNHEHYSNCLNRWRIAFQAVHAREAHTITAEATHMLSIYYNIATMLLASSLTHSEMMYDEYTPLFAEIISKAQLILWNSDDSSNTSRFTLDMGTILPLVMTAVKCRDRQIRRQAIALLWSQARREGLCFDTIIMARICAWLASIEVQSAQGGTEAARIPETSRWTMTYLHMNSEERWLAAQLTCMKPKGNGLHAYRETVFSW